MTARHTPTDRTELGYTRRVCAECGTDWPCPPHAQLREATQSMRDAYYAAKLQAELAAFDADARLCAEVDARLADMVGAP